MAPSRRALLAIEFTGDASALEEYHPAASERFRRLKDHLVAFDGKLLEAPDGRSVVLFPSVAAAVRCAASLQSFINGMKSNDSLSVGQSSPSIGIVDLLGDDPGGHPSRAEMDRAIKLMRAAPASRARHTTPLGLISLCRLMIEAIRHTRLIKAMKFARSDTRWNWR